MNITAGDIERLSKVYRGKLIKLSSGKYYCKYNLDGNNFSSLSYAVNELIAYYVLKDLKVISPKYYIVLLNEENEIYSLVSENIKKFGKFYTASEFGLTNLDGISLYSIWYYLEEHFVKDLNLYIDIIKMYLFDIFFLNVDRHVSNFGFIMKNDKYYLGVFDNENILVYNDLVPIINSSVEGEKWSLELKKIQNNINNKEEIKRIIINNLNTFINESSSEYLQLFERVYNFLNPIYFKELLEKIEKENFIYTKNGVKALIIPRKDDLIQIYQENYDLITNIWKCYKKERRIK